MNLDLHSYPVVVATVTEKSDLDFLESEIKPTAEVLEFRLDSLLPHKRDALETMRSLDIPILTTVRSPLEGGSGNLDGPTRKSIYQEALPVSNLIDIEVCSLRDGSFSDLMTEARFTGCLRIGSFHDFQAFPGIDSLKRTIDEAFAANVDIAKIAVHIAGRHQLFALANLVADTCAEGKLVSAMGMGPLGKLSRLVLPEAGSCLNYGYFQVANAPGQWSAAELHSLLKRIGE